MPLLVPFLFSAVTPIPTITREKLRCTARISANPLSPVRPCPMSIQERPSLLA